MLESTFIPRALHERLFPRTGQSRRTFPTAVSLMGRAVILGPLVVAGLSTGLLAERPGSALPERLGDLATAADRAFDGSMGWPEARAELPADLADVAALVVAHMPDEGITDAALPSNGVAWATAGPDAWHTLGDYSAWSDALTLNARYVADPGWREQPWLETLVHELVHAQGLRDEALTEAVATEVTAGLCDARWAAACVDLWDLLRSDAALTIWWSETYGEAIPVGFAGATGLRACPPSGCPAPSGEAATFEALRQRLFSDAEWAALAKRLREWTAPTQAFDYEQVIGTYVARVLPTLLATICGSGALTVDLAAITRYGMGPIRPARTVTVPLDDLAFQVATLGWRCP